MLGATISVTEYDQCDIADTDHSNSTLLPQCTVTVHGLHYNDKDEAVDCLELYFSQDSKGGEIVEDGIQIVKGKGVITFVDSEG